MGAVLSNVTPEPEVRVVVFEELVEASVAVIVNPTAPSVWEDVVKYEAVQVLPEVFVIVGLELAVTPPEVKTTVGVEIVSFEVKVRVTLSPVLAKVVDELFEVIVTDVRIGAVLSMVTVADVEVAKLFDVSLATATIVCVPSLFVVESSVPVYGEVVSSEPMSVPSM